jgi:cytochrome c556
MPPESSRAILPLTQMRARIMPPTKSSLTTTGLTLVALALATIAAAHTGVKDPSVKARMDAMGEIKDAFGLLGSMAKGNAPFDAAAAASARAHLITRANQIPSDFADKATDPMTEARPAIWQNWGDFTAKSMAMAAAFEALDVQSETTLRAGFKQAGASCIACHKSYRAKN